MAAVIVKKLIDYKNQESSWTGSSTLKSEPMSVSYPFFSGYGRDEAFPQDTDLSPVPRMEKRPLSRALEGGFIAIINCVNTEKMCQ